MFIFQSIHRRSLCARLKRPAPEHTKTYPYYPDGECRHIFVAGVVQLQVDVDHLAGRVAGHGYRCQHKQWTASTAEKQTIHVEALRFFLDNWMLFSMHRTGAKRRQRANQRRSAHSIERSFRMKTNKWERMRAGERKWGTGGWGGGGIRTRRAMSLLRSNGLMTVKVSSNFWSGQRGRSKTTCKP